MTRKSHNGKLPCLTGRRMLAAFSSGFFVVSSQARTPLLFFPWLPIANVFPSFCLTLLHLYSNPFCIFNAFSMQAESSQCRVTRFLCYIRLNAKWVKNILLKLICCSFFKGIQLKYSCFLLPIQESFAR